jgi:type I restriction enzyme S subunit
VAGQTATRFDGGYDPGYLVNRGDLLIGMDGDFNCAEWRGEPALLNQRVCKVIPDERYYSRRFLAYALQGYLSAINADTPSATGHTRVQENLHEAAGTAKGSIRSCATSRWA